MKINAKCGCGATLDADVSSYINPGGEVDKYGDLFIAQKLVREFNDIHKVCLPVVLKIKDCTAKSE